MTTLIPTKQTGGNTMNTIQAAHSALIARLAELRPRPIPTYPDQEDWDTRNAHLQDVALAVDAYILAIGRDCASNVRGSFDLSLFTARLTNDLQGNATYEIECAGNDWAAESVAYHEGRYEGVG